MYSFKDISIIVHCRIDNEERGKNAKLVYDFYKANTKDSQIIFIETFHYLTMFISMKMISTL